MLLEALVGRKRPLPLRLPTNATEPYFQLGTLTFYADEDESDGYRSALRTCETRDTAPDRAVSELVVAKVWVREAKHTRLTGWELVDKSGHVWLTIGTDEADDYYPAFRFVVHHPVKGFTCPHCGKPC